MKSIEIKPTEYILPKSPNKVFLAGSIEMGSASPWQQEVVELFKENVVFYNPRRDDWDSSWHHDSDQFNQQVNWELDFLENTDIILMYFDPATKSPISLLELGLFARSHKLIVCCPDGFWRQGNVRIVCQRFGIPFFTNKEEWLKHFENTLAYKINKTLN
jgi:hypothetical protein